MSDEKRLQSQPFFCFPIVKIKLLCYNNIARHNLISNAMRMYFYFMVKIQMLLFSIRIVFVNYVWRHGAMCFWCVALLRTFLMEEKIMEYSKEYLRVKKIVAIEEISRIILNSKDCWDMDLESFVKSREVTDKIATLLASEKTDEEIVKEIRSIFKMYKISD